MTYVILPSKRFQKALQKHHTSGRKQVVAALAEVIDLLALRDSRSLYMLSSRWSDHELKGNKKGIREMHLDHDVLLLYVVDEEQHITKLLDIVSHDDLKKQ